MYIHRSIITIYMQRTRNLTHFQYPFGIRPLTSIHDGNISQVDKDGLQHHLPYHHSENVRKHTRDYRHNIHIRVNRST